MVTKPPKCYRGGLRLRNLFRLIWGLGAVLVLVGTLLPAGSAPIQALDKLDISDKVEHFASYAVLALLPALHERRRTLGMVAGGLILLGVLLEFGQLLSPGRDFEIGDMAADSAGVCVGIAAGWPLRGRVQRGWLVTGTR